MVAELRALVICEGLRVVTTPPGYLVMMPPKHLLAEVFQRCPTVTSDPGCVGLKLAWESGVPD